MKLATQQWVAVSVGGTHLAVPGNEVAFVVPIADYHAQANNNGAVLQYAGREFPVFQLNKDLNLAHNNRNGRFCVCLGSAQQTPFVLVVESLMQITFDQHVVLGEIPDVMHRPERDCPVFAVAQSAETFLLLCTAASLAETIQQQLPEVEEKTEVEHE